MRLLIFLGFWTAVFAAIVSVANSGTDSTLAMIIACCGFVYFLPSSIGFIRKHRYRWLILASNIFVGWTGVGLLALFVWAVWPKNTSLNPPLEYSVLAPLDGDMASHEPAMAAGGAGGASGGGSPAVYVVGAAVLAAALFFGWRQHEAQNPVVVAETGTTTVSVPERQEAIAETPPNRSEAHEPALGPVPQGTIADGAGCTATDDAGNAIFVTDFSSAAIRLEGQVVHLNAEQDSPGAPSFSSEAGDIQVQVLPTADSTPDGEEGSVGPANLALTFGNQEQIISVTYRCES